MSLSKANTLLRAKRYQEAYDEYMNLLGDVPDIICKTNIDYIRKKISIPEHKNLKTKIIFVTAGLQGPNGGGGIGTTFSTMIETLSDYGEHDIDVLYTAHPYYKKGNKDYWKEEFKKKSNIGFHCLEINKKNYGSLEMNKSHEILKFLSNRDNIYDVIVFHDFMGLGYFSVLAKKLGIFFKNTEIVISAHGNNTLSFQYSQKFFDSWQLKATRYMERMCLEMSENTTSPSDFYSTWLTKNFSARNVNTLKNIILKNTETGEDTRPKEKYNYIFFYGRLDRLKGLDIFIEAITKLKNSETSYKVVFAGTESKIDGIPSTEYIKEKLTKENIDFSFQLNVEPEKFYNEVKSKNGFCVFPTRGETSSCVVVECALHGVPFIAAGIEPIKELLQEHRHDEFLFTPDDTDSLLEKIKTPPQSVDPNILSFQIKEIQDQWVKYLKRKKPTKEPQALPIENDLVSIIIPTKDRPELLKIALSSLKKQTYKNIEIIVIDDNSTEWKKNSEIAESLGSKYIRLSKSTFKGAACNIAAKSATGKYICFFDDDDISKPEMIENYITAFTHQPENDIISCFADVFEHSEDTGKICPEYVSLALGGGLEVNLHINFFGKGTFIVRRSVFEALGGYIEDPGMVPMVDYRFYVNAATSGYKITIIPIPMYYYRKNSPNSLFYGNSQKKAMLFEAKHSLQKILEKNLGKDLGICMSTIVWEASLPSMK